MRLVGLISKGYSFSGADRGEVMGGAQITHLELLAGLAAEFGHECHLLTVFPANRTARASGVRVASYRDREELWQRVESLRPDAVLGALEPSCDTVRIAQHFGIPSLLFLHSYEASPLPRSLRERYGLSGTEAALTPLEWEYALSHADRVYACSRYLQTFVAARGSKCSHVYPEFSKARTLIEQAGSRAKAQDDGFITGICGFTYKGAEIFLGLARAFPTEQFQLFGTVEPRLASAFEQQTNIALRPHGRLADILREAKLVVVPSQWPEPFGRIAVEALANGVPALVSATGGLMEAAADPRFQVRDYRRLSAWVKRVSAWLNDSAMRPADAERGRQLAGEFLKGKSTRTIERDLHRLISRRKTPQRAATTIALCGDHAAKTAYSLINSEIASASRSTARRVISLRKPSDFHAERLDVTIHHDYAQDFKAVEFPDEGKVIAIRTWDFGKYPPSWVKRIDEEVDQLWVHCRWVRDNAIRSGIPKAKVRVIPWGVDPGVFHPDGPAGKVPTRKRFRFLFVGRTIVRKGIDTLLAAYSAAFRPEDDVCLVIKDNTRDVFYRGIDYQQQIRAFAADHSKPELLYLDRFLPAANLAALYRACDAGVFPYRAEGFCLPILEAMACGLPVIVPRFGACLDFCSDKNAYFVPAKRISLPVTRVFAINTLGFEEHVDEVDFCEVAVRELAERMRAVYQDRNKSIETKGRDAAQLALSSFRWADTVARMESCLAEVGAIRVPIRLRNRRRVLERSLSLFEAAKDLYLTRDHPR